MKREPSKSGIVEYPYLAPQGSPGPRPVPASTAPRLFCVSGVRSFRNERRLPVSLPEAPVWHLHELCKGDCFPRVVSAVQVIP